MLGRSVRSVHLCGLSGLSTYPLMGGIFHGLPCRRKVMKGFFFRKIAITYERLNMILMAAIG